MADTTKQIADLDFDLAKAEQKLKQLSQNFDNHVKKIENSSNDMSKTIEKSFGKININDVINTQAFKNGLNKMEKYSTSTYEKIAKDISTVTKTQLQQEQKRLNNQETFEQKRQLQAQKTADKLKIEEQKLQNKLTVINSKGMSDRIRNIAEATIGVSTGVEAFHALKNAAIDTVDAIKKVEYRMMEITRIMDTSNINITEYRDSLIGLAYDYGRTFDEVSSVTLNFARAGNDAQESILLTEKALLALNTAELDASEATDGLISIMAQWGLDVGTAEEQAANLELVIDKINKTADNFPISSQGLLEALQRTSQGFNLAGASIDETIALIVAAERSAQRGGKTIGTAMSNMVQQLKAESKLNLAENLGIEFFEDEAKTTFKSVTDIFGAMSEKMTELKEQGKENSTEMQQLLELFTVFRRNIGAGLLTEMEGGEDSTYFKALQNSLDAAGYSAEENSKYMSTMEAATQQLNATILQLQMTLGDEGGKELFAGLILGAESGINIIDSLIETFGLVPTAVGAVVLAYNLLSKNTLYDKMEDQIGTLKDLAFNFRIYNSEIKEGGNKASGLAIIGNKLTDSQKDYISSLKSGNATVQGYIKNLITTNARTLILKVSTAALQAGITMGLSFAIESIIGLFQDWANALENATESVSEMNDNISETNSSVENYISSFKNLRNEMDSGKLTQEEYNSKKSELIDIQEELIKKYGSEAQGIDLVTGSIESQTEAIERLARAEYTRNLQENMKEITKLAKDLEKVQATSLELELTGSENLNKYIKNTIKSLGGEVSTRYSDYGPASTYAEFEGTAEEILDVYRELFDKVTEYSQGLSEEDAKFANNFLINISNKISELDLKYAGSISEYEEFLNNRLSLDSHYSTSYTKILEARSALEQAYLNGDLKAIEQAKIDLQNAYTEALSQAETDTLVSDGMKEKLSDDLAELQETADSQIIKIKFEANDSELKEKVQDIISNMGDITSEELKESYAAADELSSAIDKMPGGFEKYITSLEGAKEISVEYTENMQLLKSVLEEAGIPVEDFIDNLDNLGIVFGYVSEETQKVNSTIETFEEATQKSIQSLYDLESGFTSVYNAMYEFNENGYISASTLQTLINNDLLQYFDLVNGQLVINEAQMANAATAAKAKAQMDLAAQTAAEIAAIAFSEESNQVGSASIAATTMADNTNKVKNSLIEIIPKILEGASAWDEYMASMGATVEGLSSDQQNQIKGLVDNYQKSINLLNNMNITAVSYSRATPSSYSRGSGSSGSSGRTSAAETEKNTILQDFKDAISEREKLEQRWVKKQKELGQISLNDQKYILQQEIDRYKKYADEVMKLAGVTEEEKLEVRKEYLQKAEDLELDYFGLLEDELNDAIDKIEELYDERIAKIEEAADAEIEALQKVEDENDRIREKEEYLAKRQEIIHGHQGIEYWEQRTGREAQLALAEARKELEDLDREWQEKQAEWTTEDQIKAIEERRDAEIAAAEEQMNAEIAAIQATYDYRVKMFAETGKIIFDDAVIQSKALYQAYKTNFIDPVGTELRNALSQQSSVTTATKDYTVQWGDTLTTIANRFGTSIAKIMSANPSILDSNKIYAGSTLKIPQAHTGKKVLGNGMVELQKGEVVLNTKWARDLDRMLEMYSRPSSSNTVNNNGNNVTVKGDMIKVEAKIEDKSDINTLTRKIRNELKNSFSIK